MECSTQYLTFCEWPILKNYDNPLCKEETYLSCIINLTPTYMCTNDHRRQLQTDKMAQTGQKHCENEITVQMMDSILKLETVSL